MNLVQELIQRLHHQVLLSGPQQVSLLSPIPTELAPQPLNTSSLVSQNPEPAIVEPTPQNLHPMQTRAKNKITKLTKKLTLFRRHSMSAEYDAQLENNMFDLVPPARGQHVIDTMNSYCQIFA